MGSSKIITGGSCTSVRAMETFCFMPVERLSQRRSGKSTSRRGKESLDAAAQRFPVHSVQMAEVFDHLSRGEPAVQRRRRGKKADVGANFLRARAECRTRPRARVPLAGLEDGGQRAQCGGLAGAVGAQQARTRGPAGSGSSRRPRRGSVPRLESRNCLLSLSASITVRAQSGPAYSPSTLMRMRFGRMPSSSA